MTHQDPPPSRVDALPFYPEFSFANEAVDGLVPSCRVESWKNFAEILNGSTEPASDGMIYRGHRRSDWQLEPTLARYFGGGAIVPGIAGSLLERFRLAMRGRGYDLSEKAPQEIWAFGQHFGLATPLLDWTESPYVALFFAFLKEDSEHETENPTRAIFRINRALVAEVLPDLFFEPSLGENARLVNQAGLFTITSDGSDNLVSEIINALTEQSSVNPDDPAELSRYICKIHIPNQDRIACLNSLRLMNIHHANLFPDPMGASEYCNDWLSRKVLDEKRKDDERKEAERRKEILSARAKETPSGAPGQNELADIIRIIATYADDAGIADQAEVFARRIDEKYHEVKSLDWPGHDSAKARVRTAFKRLLLSAGASDIMRDKIADELIQIYKERYLKGESPI